MRVIFIALAASISASGHSFTAEVRPENKSSLVRPFETSTHLKSVDSAPFPLETARVVTVTTIASEGPGSLRAALAEKGPRVVVFEVGGVIDLEGISLGIREPFAFIAGETAPAPGITLIRGGIVIQTHHVTLRHLAVRPGDGRPEGASAWEPDGITIVRGSQPVHDVLIENCSATWAVDENTSVSGPRDVRPSAGPDATARRITFRNNLIAEALLRSTHSKGAHSMGLLVHDGIREVVIEGNLFAHNRERNPRLKGGVEAVVALNVIYNWGSAAIGMGARGNQELLAGARALVVGNVAIAGPDTKGRVLVRSVDPGAEVEATGNLARDIKASDLAHLDPNISPLATPMSWATTSSGAPSSAASTLRAVLDGVGARPAERDPIDRRIIASVIDGTGRIIDSQSEVGGYPVRPRTRRPVTVPATGEERRIWLERLMKDLARSEALDLTPLLSRQNLPR